MFCILKLSILITIPLIIAIIIEPIQSDIQSSQSTWQSFMEIIKNKTLLQDFDQIKTIIEPLNSTILNQK